MIMSLVGVTGLRLVMMGLFKADGEKVCMHGMGVITVYLVPNRQNMNELGKTMRR